MDLWQQFMIHPRLRLVLSSALFLLVLGLLRWIVIRSVHRRTELPVEERRKFLVNLRWMLFFLLLGGMVLIWAQELRNLALSFVAFAVAMVLATKELILCLSGTFLAGSAKTFDVGDRIECRGIRGDVMDKTLLTTLVFETGPGQKYLYTGRAITLPNSIFLTEPVTVETFMGKFVVHSITVPLLRGDDWERAEAILMRVATEECMPFLEDARRHMHFLEHKRWIETPSVNPRVTLDIPNPDRVDLMLRIPSPAREKGRLEQTILRRFLKEYQGPEGKTE